MDGSDIVQIIIIVALIGLSAFFSSAETSYTTINKIKLRTMCKEGNKGAVRVQKILENPGRMLSSILVGNNIVNIAVSSLVTTFTIKLFGNAATGISTGILTVVLLILGEITPKTLASNNAETIACLYSKPIKIIIIILTPVVFIIDKLSSIILKIFRTDNKKPTATITEAEFRTMLDVAHEEGVFEDGEKAIIHNVFEFDDQKVKEVMVPKIDVCMIEQNATFEELLEVFREGFHSKIPVYDKETDKVIGILHIKDLLMSDAYTDAEARAGFKLSDIIRNKPYFTFENQTTSVLFEDMKKKAVSAAVVLDEYGVVTGFVTMQDLVEEITGHMEDEHDMETEAAFREVAHGKYRVEGGFKLDDINEKLETAFTSDDNDSIGGLLMERLDRFPKAGDSIVDNGYKISVIAAENDRVESVLLEKIHEEKEQENKSSEENNDNANTTEGKKREEKNNCDK